MFTVLRKEDNKEFVVYSISNDKTGYPHFLIYEDGQWKWQSAKIFKPYHDIKFPVRV